MSAQLQVRNLRNRYDTRPNQNTGHSPTSNLSLNGRGPKTAIPTARTSRSTRLSPNQHAQLPPRNVNKADKRQDKPKPLSSKGNAKSTKPKQNSGKKTQKEPVPTALSTIQSPDVVDSSPEAENPSTPIIASHSTDPTGTLGDNGQQLTGDRSPPSDDINSQLSTSSATLSKGKNSQSLTSDTPEQFVYSTEENESGNVRPTSSTIQEQNLANESQLYGRSHEFYDERSTHNSDRIQPSHPLSHSNSDPSLYSFNRKISFTDQPFPNSLRISACPPPHLPGYYPRQPPHEVFDTSSHELGNLPPSQPSDPWHLTFQQLRTMGGRMTKLDSKLDSIEETTDTLKSQMQEVLGRTINLEKQVQVNVSDLETIKNDLVTLKQTVVQQQETISQLKKSQKDKDVLLQNNFSTIKKSLEAQGKKTEQLSSLRSKVRSDVEAKLQSHKEQADYDALKKQAYSNRSNLVLLGISENTADNPRAQAVQFFKDEFKLTKLSISTAYRIGKVPAQDSSYVRPILVKFTNTIDRNRVWRKRKEIKEDQNGNLPRIQPDMPKQLREDLQIMYRVINEASTYDDYQSAEIRDFSISLNGEKFSPRDLEKLPEEIRPSTISTRYSDNTLVFFTRYTCLSNHFPSIFKIDGRAFNSVEHFLALKRAQLSKDEDIIQQARNARDPSIAKAILNTLKQDHPQEWKQQAPLLAKEALRAKFDQNPPMADYLCSTQPLYLGEASTNPIWGIGLQLDNADVLDRSKWIKSGNLLGRTLMQIRNEIVTSRGQPQN